MGGHSILAVIPSVLPEAEDFAELDKQMRSFHCRTVVMANSARATRVLDELGLDFHSTGENLGFGPTVEYAAARWPNWDWLLIVNDDIRFRHPLPASVLTTALDTTAGVVVLADESPRPIPDLWAVFMSVSLLGRALKGVPRMRRCDRKQMNYWSFSFVAIRRETWHELGGFDPRLVFTYEDADFTNRAYREGWGVECRPLPGVRHEHSSSTGALIDTVLPVSVWSAKKFLETSGDRSRTIINCVLVLALLLRVPMVVFNRAPRGRHWRGIGASLRSVLLESLPRMPKYEEIA